MTNSYTATYSPEDNKLRLYAARRLDADTYDRIKALGFRWAPRQELFFAPAWSPDREDILLELAGEIEAEEMTLAERAAMKAERLDQLATKRAAQANAYARRADDLSQAFHMGQPILVGHHSERKARRTQSQMHSAMDNATKAHKAANYWLYRAEGVERFANMKNRDRTRANRIKTLLAELRDFQRRINAAHKALAGWEKITSPDQIRFALAECDHRLTFGTHDDYVTLRNDPDKAEEIRAACIKRARAAVESPRRARWITHTLNRLGFERHMLGEVARFTGDLTPAILQTFARTHGAEKPAATRAPGDSWEVSSPLPLPLHMGDGCALTLTAEGWRDLMQALGYEVPQTERKAPRRGSTVPLINPTLEQAEALQEVWNREAIRKHPRQVTPETCTEVLQITQARYSANSKGEYAPLKSCEIDARGLPVVMGWRGGEFVRSAEPVARVRMRNSGRVLYGANAVVHLTDAPAKALPITLEPAPVTEAAA